MALSDTFVRAVKPSDKPAGDKHADGLGLYLLVKPAGKYWRMDYRHGGKRKTLALGVYPAVTLAKARKARDTARELLADGQDPSEAKRTRKAAEKAEAVNTVEAVGLAWLATHKDGWSATHYTREERNLRKDVFPYLGNRAIGTIEPPELLKVIRKVEERGALDVAHRVLLTSRGVWQHAVAEGHATRDITQDIKGALKPHLKRNLPAIIDPLEFGELLRASDAYQGGPVVRAALAIAPVLFQRPGNLRTMRWADLDLEAGLWAIPSEDMKRTKVQKLNGQAHVVPLPRQVVETLRELQPLTGGREYVFPGFRDPTAPMSEAGINAALHAMGYKGRHCWHGYRASGRTMLRQQLKFDVDVIEAQLAHRGQITHNGAYDRAQHVDERTQMVQAWADYLDKLRAGAEVFQFKAA
ncbi:tyrosine-type recombinase/integrase [Ottowia sp. VDI28]|uniref:tyrosine-type recombinase/integrase n=1 Tax=Ottowia sp. VDI28 TaxID=3133968 RepID=UPI003C2DAFC0